LKSDREREREEERETNKQTNGQNAKGPTNHFYLIKEIIGLGDDTAKELLKKKPVNSSMIF
jgi:hypothetical protein